MSEIRELPEFTNDHIAIHLLENKPVIGTTPRQFIDKKIFFRTSDADSSVKGTDQDEFYIWVTSTPDDIVPIDSKKYVRAESILGIQRIGKRKDGEGCYLHAIVQTDVKVSSWTNKLLYPIMPK